MRAAARNDAQLSSESSTSTARNQSRVDSHRGAPGDSGRAEPNSSAAKTPRKRPECKRNTERSHG